MEKKEGFLNKLDNLVVWTLLSVIGVGVLLVLFFAIGLLIGYGPIGGGNALDVFRWETWQHIFDFIK